MSNLYLIEHLNDVVVPLAVVDVVLVDETLILLEGSETALKICVGN